MENLLEMPGINGTMKGQAGVSGGNIARTLVGLGVGVGVSFMIGPPLITAGISAASLTGLAATLAGFVIPLFIVVIVMIFVYLL